MKTIRLREEDCRSKFGGLSEEVLKAHFAYQEESFTSEEEQVLRELKIVSWPLYRVFE